MQPDQTVATRWSGAAPFWEKHRATIRQFFAPVSEALIEDARIGRGHTVLDIATGPGEPAATIATHVGPQGRAIGIDLVPGMAEAARRSTARLGLTNAHFGVASAQHLPFAAGSFDSAVSRFGVMFFPSPVDGVREMLQVLKPGGRVALAVWDFADRNPFFYTLTRVLERYVVSPPMDPDAPDAFRFASPAKLKDVLAQAGAQDATERILQFTIRAQVSAEEYWTLRCEMSETLREKLAKLSNEQVAEVKRQSLEALRNFSTSEGMRFPAQVLIVSGRKGA
jgi:ubiquinone/menaquinone biosynthesis C-methylase UbiE